MNLRKTLAVGVSVGLAVVALAPGVSATQAKIHTKLCGVRDSGFTYMPAPLDDPERGAFVTYGLIVSNKTKRVATDFGIFVNFYDSRGRLVQTEDADLGPSLLGARDTQIRGFTVGAKAEIASMRVFATCAKQSADEAEYIQAERHQRVTGAVAQVTSDGIYVIGHFTNRGPIATFGYLSYLLRDASGRIVGGNWCSPLGTVPRGVTIEWEDAINAVLVQPPATIEGTVGGG